MWWGYVQFLLYFCSRYDQLCSGRRGGGELVDDADEFNAVINGR